MARSNPTPTPLPTAAPTTPMSTIGTQALPGGSQGPMSQGPFVGAQFGRYPAGAPQGSAMHYLGVGFGFAWDMSEIGEALDRSFAFLSNYPSAALVSDRAAFALRYCIQNHVPIGPARDLSSSKAAEAGAFGTGPISAAGRAEISRLLQEAKAGGTTEQLTQAELDRGLKDIFRIMNDMERARGERRRGLEAELRGLGIDPKRAGDFDYVQTKARANMSRARGVAAGRVSIPGNPSGKLFDSIGVDATGTGPTAVMRAESVSYYGWFVEHGVRQAMRPVIEFPHPNMATAIHRDQIGAYPWVGGMLADRANSGNWSSAGDIAAGTLRGAGAGDMEGSMSMETPPFIAFVPASGSIEGAHFMEKGLSDFVTKLHLSWGSLASRGHDAVWYGKASPARELAKRKRLRVGFSYVPTATGFGDTPVIRGAGGKFVSYKDKGVYRG